jgi:hypothetical protein
MVWATHDYSYEDTWLIDRLVAVAEQIDPTADDLDLRALRCRLLATRGMEMEGVGDADAMAAARRGVDDARELGDPAVLCYALDGLARQLMGNGTWAERQAVADETIAVANAHDLAGHQGLGHFLREQADLAVGDLDAAAAHGAELARLGEAYSLPGLVVVSRQVPAVLALARGDLDDATRLYGEFADALRSIGAFSVDALEWMASWLIAHQRGLGDDMLQPAREAAAVYPPLGPLLVRALLDAGHRDEAAAEYARRLPARRDLLWSLFVALDAENTLELGTDTEVAAAYDELLGAAGELAGASSGFFTVGPVDTALARLATRLGRDDVAREHAAVGLALATRVGNARWISEAEAAGAAVLATD